MVMDREIMRSICLSRDRNGLLIVPPLNKEPSILLEGSLRRQGPWTTCR